MTANDLAALAEPGTRDGPDSGTGLATAEHFRLLSETRRMQHSGRSFFDHLYGVYRLLVLWRCDRTTCLAGLFHSAYGTEIYQEQLLGSEDRERLAAQIGKDAERVVFAFCAATRASISNTPFERPDISSALEAADGGGRFDVSGEDLLRLRAIEIANRFEQAFRTASPDPSLFARVGDTASKGAAIAPDHPAMLCAAIERDAELRAGQSYRAALADAHAGAAAALENLESSIALVPVAAEPHLLAAAALIELGEHDRALAMAAHGRRLLEEWGGCWDRRIEPTGWAILATKLEQLAISGGSQQAVWAPIRQSIAGGAAGSG